MSKKEDEFEEPWNYYDEHGLYIDEKPKKKERYYIDRFLEKLKRHNIDCDCNKRRKKK